MQKIFAAANVSFENLLHIKNTKISCMVKKGEMKITKVKGNFTLLQN